MRTRMILLAVLFFVCGSQVLCQDEKPPIDIPVYPKADVTTEVNLTQQDILPMIQATMPLLGGSLGKLGGDLEPEDIAAILADVRQIEFLQLEIKSRKVGLAQVAAFYAKNLPAGAWTRVFYRSSADSGTLAVYYDAGSEAYYGFQTRAVTTAGKHVKQVDAGKIVGKIDFAALIRLAARVV